MEAIYPEIVVHKDGIEVVLPELINHFLFDALGAIHNPAGRSRSFDRNIDATHNQVLTYLGTYFPRSLAESFVIFDSLLSDKTFANWTTLNDSISICSVGTGTGGDLIGLILALEKRLPSQKRIDIVSIEGNITAHETMWRFLELMGPHLQSEIYVNLVQHTFKAPMPFDNLDDYLPTTPLAFNFVISSKMLNELDSACISTSPYYEFCAAFSKRLKPEGVMLILDVTSPNSSSGQWTPILLNGQVNEFLAFNERYKTILPLLCNRFENECHCNCFTQNTIRATYRNVTNECSRVCYRMIGSIELSEKLSASPDLWDCPITKDNKGHCKQFHGRD